MNLTRVFTFFTAAIFWFSAALARVENR